MLGKKSDDVIQRTSSSVRKDIASLKLYPGNEKVLIVTIVVYSRNPAAWVNQFLELDKIGNITGL